MENVTSHHKTIEDPKVSKAWHDSNNELNKKKISLSTKNPMLKSIGIETKIETVEAANERNQVSKREARFKTSIFVLITIIATALLIQQGSICVSK